MHLIAPGDKRRTGTIGSHRRPALGRLRHPVPPASTYTASTSRFSNGYPATLFCRAGFVERLVQEYSYCLPKLKPQLKLLPSLITVEVKVWGRGGNLTRGCRYGKWHSARRWKIATVILANRLHQTTENRSPDKSTCVCCWKQWRHEKRYYFVISFPPRLLHFPLPRIGKTSPGSDLLNFGLLTELRMSLSRYCCKLLAEQFPKQR